MAYRPAQSGVGSRFQGSALRQMAALLLLVWLAHGPLRETSAGNDPSAAKQAASEVEVDDDAAAASASEDGDQAQADDGLVGEISERDFSKLFDEPGQSAGDEATVNQEAMADDDVETTEPEDNAELRSQPSTHKQVAAIAATAEERSALKAFALAPDGTVLALVQVGLAADEEEAPQESPSVLTLLFGSGNKAAKAPAEPVEPGARVRVFDAAGKRLTEWPVDFMAEAIAQAPSGEVYLAGSGRIGRYTLEGKQLAVADTPQTAVIEQDREALRKAAEEQINEQKSAYAETIKQFTDQRDALNKKKAKGKLSDDEQQELAMAEATLDAYKQIEQQSEDLETVVEGIVGRLKRINALTVGDSDVFLTCGQTKGYGYAVWRMGLDFSEPKSIIAGLSGCCGQMDVCCRNGELWVAENSRHRVVRYDRDGKRLAAFGKRDRDGIGAGFGGCCNPMNLCFTMDGDLLVAESDGQVKQFSTDGKFLGLVGVAHVAPGCKCSAVATSAAGDRVYYIDVQKSQILVLAREAQPKTAAE